MLGGSGTFQSVVACVARQSLHIAFFYLLLVPTPLTGGDNILRVIVDGIESMGVSLTGVTNFNDILSMGVEVAAILWKQINEHCSLFSPVTSLGAIIIGGLCTIVILLVLRASLALHCDNVVPHISHYLGYGILPRLRRKPVYERHCYKRAALRFHRGYGAFCYVRLSKRRGRHIPDDRRLERQRDNGRQCIRRHLLAHSRCNHIRRLPQNASRLCFRRRKRRVRRHGRRFASRRRRSGCNDSWRGCGRCRNSGRSGARRLPQFRRRRRRRRSRLCLERGRRSAATPEAREVCSSSSGALG